jgi:radical SAM superfamily enzyme YgiQ (UPF0313 family)
MTDSFPITLAFPPQGHFTQPYLALPCIQAWLKQQGFADVELRDLSIEAYDHFLSKPQLERAARLVEERLPLASFESAESLPFERMDAFRAAAESAVSARAVIDRVEDAKRIVRSERAFEMDAYVPAVRTLYHGLRLVSAAHFPSKLTPHNFTMGYANDRSAEVLAATLDEQQNPFIDFFRERVLPGLIARKPRVLGLSVIYGSQLIPALTLGRMVKEALPDCHITAGGGFLAYIGEKLMNAPGIDVCIDSIIFHEGEAPMEALCKALKGGTDLIDVGSLMWIDRSGDTPRAVRNIGMHPVKLDDAPVPDFTGIPFELYFSPETVIPYDINRGCYYGECAFCTLPTVIGPGYRTRSAGSIVDHVLALKERHGARNVNFITDCMPPGMIRDLPQELIDREADIAWWCDARVEPKAYDEEGAKLLHDSGCRKLLFGFETATPRLLKMMKKGQSLKSTVDVATNCANAGISVTFYAMVGFPTETREEARATLDFLREHAGVVREVSLQTFHIDEVAQTYREPEIFGIEILDDPEADLQLYHDYVAKEGMTQEEAAEMFEEMMQGFREFLPLFTGDTILYFMQKSHYFLHLARGATPASFEAECRERTAARASRGATPELAAGDGLQLIELPYGYNEVRRTLATPLARAVRPDFLTGRFDAHAAETAAARLAPIPPRRRVLAYDGDAAEFCELTPDGARALDAIRDAGSLGALIESIDPALDANGSARAKLEGFAAELHRLGLLAPRDRAALVQG